MRAPWLIILLATVSLLAGAAVACGGGGDGDDDDTSATPPASGGEPTDDGEPVGVADLAHGVVQIFALNEDGDPIWSGSGTIITKDGLILTNGHVVDDRYDEYSTLGVGLTVETDKAPEIAYTAEIAAVDYTIDLAVIQLTETIDGDPILEDFPFIDVGDSDAVEIGDDIQVLGYPGIGGETITFTRGAISGFTTDRLVGERAWIKTDATIAGGNSGGLAVNDDGELIGVPTVVGSGADADTVDCRILSDTNGDGSLDENDTCVSVGGFINGIRPVNLAADLIAAAEAGDEYVSPYTEEEDSDATPVPDDFDTSDIFFTNVIFSPDVTETDEPTEQVVVLPSLPPAVCAFWDYEGMADGLTYDALWYVDGELNQDGSFIGDSWAGGETGNWWVCINDEDGLTDGLYEVILQVEGDLIASKAIYAGDDHEVTEVEFENQAGIEVCAVAFSPTGTQNWGGDVLGAGITLLPGDLHTVEVGTGTYDILAIDCDGNTIEENYEIEVDFSGGTYTITGQ